jgi:hypothetical protein
MKFRRKLSRRSFLAQVAGASVTGAGALAAVAGEAAAFQLTDSDTGPRADPAGRGRGARGVTDGDPGDPAGRGRGGITDNDPGDPVGHGRGAGVTDGDPGDPVGRGRGRGSGPSGVSDTDPRDPAGSGRGRGRTGITDRDPADPNGNGRGSCSDSDRGLGADPGGRGRRC